MDPNLPAELALLQKMQEEDEYERSYDPDDLTRATEEEILEALGHLPTKDFLEFCEEVRTGDFREVGILFSDAVKAYRRL